MFVDKVEPEEMRIAPTGKQVPRRCDGEKYGQA